jgi:ATP-dependent helicase HrpA
VVNLKLFRSQAAARHASLGGVQRLVELALQKDLGWLQKDLRSLVRLAPLAGSLASEELQVAAFANLRRHLLPAEPLPALTQAHFQAAVAEARRRLPGLAVQFEDRLEAILKLRQDILRRAGPPPAPVTQLAAKPKTLSSFHQLTAAPVVSRPPSLLATELAALLPGDYIASTPFERLPHMPRYLKALLIRAERAALNPAKDAERARQLAPYLEALRQLQPKTESGKQKVESSAPADEFRWLVEEFKVSLFAQELGTAVPVSPQRLDAHLERLRQAPTP